MASCLTPIYFKNGTSAPCGHCSECLRRYANGWSLRLQKQYSVSTHVYFNTLTYDDDNLPVNNARFSCNDVLLSPLRCDKLYVADEKNNVFVVSRDKYYNSHSDYSTYFSKPIVADRLKELFPYVHDVPTVLRSDVVLYHKRLRHYFDGLDIKIKYYCVSEYGERTFRPHYHELLFFSGIDSYNLSIENVRSAVLQSWNKGNIDLSAASSFACINYTTKYLRKKCPCPVGASPPFRLISKGLGSYFLSKHRLELLKLGKDKVRFSFSNGKSCPMPRYYRDKLFEPTPMEDQIKFRRTLTLRKSRDYLDYLALRGLEDTKENYENFSLSYSSYLSNVSDLANNSSLNTSVIKVKD